MIRESSIVKRTRTAKAHRVPALFPQLPSCKSIVYERHDVKNIRGGTTKPDPVPDCTGKKARNSFPSPVFDFSGLSSA